MPLVTNGDKKTIRLNGIINNAMHRPRVKDGDESFVLYTKVKDADKQSTEGTSKAEQSTKYMNTCESNYNSATNIRAVFITYNRVYVNYYKDLASAKGDGKTFTSAQIESDVSIIDAAKKIVTYETDFRKWNNNRSLDPKAKGPTQYSITGNFFGIFNEPYTCNNIEEIYFDWSALLCSELAPVIAQNGLANYVSLVGYNQFITGNYQYELINNDDVFKDCFCRFAFDSSEQGKLRNGMEAFRKKFPRLKIIAMVSKLKDVLESIQNASYLPTIGSDLSKGLSNTWLDRHIDIIKSYNSIVIMTLLKDLPKYNTKFIIKDTQYKFDRVFLKNTAETYKKAVEDKIRKDKYGDTKINNKEKENEEIYEIGEIEKQILKAEELVGRDETKLKRIITNSILREYTNKEIGSIFMSFSKPNRERWSKLVGLKIS